MRQRSSGEDDEDRGGLGITYEDDAGAVIPEVALRRGTSGECLGVSISITVSSG